MPQPPKITTLDDLERIPGPGSLTWLPVRHTLGIEAFGCNAYVATKAGEDVVEPHTEADAGHQELYFVARGHATFTIDGTEHDAPAGTYVFMPDPESHRRAVAEVAGTTVLSFGGPPVFEPSPWEWYMRAVPLMHDPATRDSCRAMLSEARERFPNHAVVLYNIACLEAIDGDADAAFEALKASIAARPEVAGWARDDEDFASLAADPRMAQITGER